MQLQLQCEALSICPLHLPARATQAGTMRRPCHAYWILFLLAFNHRGSERVREARTSSESLRTVQLPSRVSIQQQSSATGSAGRAQPPLMRERPNSFVPATVPVRGITKRRARINGGFIQSRRRAPHRPPAKCPAAPASPAVRPVPAPVHESFRGLGLSACSRQALASRDAPFKRRGRRFCPIPRRDRPAPSLRRVCCLEGLEWPSRVCLAPGTRDCVRACPARSSSGGRGRCRH